MFSKNKTGQLIYWSLFAIFVAGAILVRMHDFGKYPADINCDESMAAVEAMALVENGTDHYGTPFPVYFEAWGHGQMNVLYSYLLAGFIKLFGVSTFVVRLPMLVFSLIGIAALTWMAWLVFSKEATLFVLAFAAINPWQIITSRWALESNIFPHFLVIGTALLFFAVKKKKLWALCLSFLIFGFSLYGYGVAYSYIAIFMVSVFLLLFFSKTFRLKELLIATLCFFAVSWPIILMMAVNYFKLPTFSIAGITIQFYEKTTRMGDVLFFSDNFWRQLGINFQHLWDRVILQKMDLWWNQIPKTGTYYQISLPFLLIGLIGISRVFNDNRKVKTWNSGAVCIAILMISILTSLINGLIINEVNVTRINHIYYPIIFVTAYGIY